MLYRTYREGDISFVQEIQNGIYDITLHFIEPRDTPVGARLFDVLVEDTTQISNLDIRGLRDGKIHSALSRTIPSVRVTDGYLNISLKGVDGAPYY